MVTQYILEYLISHPHAKDTLTGISQWWLPKSIGTWSEADIQAALDELVEKGWVTQRQIIFSQALYGLNQDKLDAILEYLDTHD